MDFWSIQIEPWLLNGALSRAPGQERWPPGTARTGSGADNVNLGVYAGLVRLARELPDPPIVEPTAALMHALERAAQTAWGAYLSHATVSPASDPRFGWMPQWHASSARLASETLIAVVHAALAATRSERGRAHDKGLARLAFEALLSDPALSRRQLCDRLGSSEGNLSRRFPDLFGVSLVQQRARLRLVRFLSLAKRSQASNLLRSSLEAGFGSYAQLHRVFWQHSSCTPSDYLVGEGRLRAGAVVRID